MSVPPTKDTTDGQPPRPGHENASAPAPIDPATGQHLAYWILSADERAAGFVRPVRRSYMHVGCPKPTGVLRDLTKEERDRHSGSDYVAFEEYPPSESSILGRYWTGPELARSGRGCGAVTTMSRAIAETYARQPSFYGATFCVGCHRHLPVGAQGEFVWIDERGCGTSERVGT